MTIGGESDIPWYVVFFLISGFIGVLATMATSLKNIERILARMEDKR